MSRNIILLCECVCTCVQMCVYSVSDRVCMCGREGIDTQVYMYMHECVIANVWMGVFVCLCGEGYCLPFVCVCVCGCGCVHVGVFSVQTTKKRRKDAT